MGGLVVNPANEVVPLHVDTNGSLFVAAGVTSNPSSPLTRPADTTAYAANDLIASNTTAGSVVVPSFTAMRVAAGGASIAKLRLLSNHTANLGSVGVKVRLWSAAPTYTNGDNGAYAVATGAAGHLGTFTGTFEQFGDGASAALVPDAGSFDSIKLAAGQLIYWDLQTTTAFTPQSGKTFTLVPQVLQD
jgi:hypothetical protein